MNHRELAMTPTITLDGPIDRDEVVALYRAHQWSSAEKPEALMRALRGSHSLVTARVGALLVGIGNAISDGYLVVYYPHLLVHPEHQGRGIGRRMMAALSARYAGFHQQMLTADADAVGFYQRLGFEQAGRTLPMWVYGGAEHS